MVVEIGPGERRADHHTEHLADGTAGEAVGRGSGGEPVERDGLMRPWLNRVRHALHGSEATELVNPREKTPATAQAELRWRRSPLGCQVFTPDWPERFAGANGRHGAGAHEYRGSHWWLAAGCTRAS
jgi:hypothetical protein